MTVRQSLSAVNTENPECHKFFRRPDGKHCGVGLLCGKAACWAACYESAGVRIAAVGRRMRRERGRAPIRLCTEGREESEDETHDATNPPSCGSRLWAGGRAASAGMRQFSRWVNPPLKRQNHPPYSLLATRFARSRGPGALATKAMPTGRRAASRLRDYSCLSDSTGFSRDARRAGSRPKTIPIVTAKTTGAISRRGE
jgi:hypothetical protein